MMIKIFHLLDYETRLCDTPRILIPTGIHVLTEHEMKGQRISSVGRKNIFEAVQLLSIAMDTFRVWKRIPLLM